MKILVFHRAAGFVHQSIPHAVLAIEELSNRHNFECVSTDDAAMFTGEHLAGFDALVFLQTSGDVLPEDSQRAALEQYINNGGGYFGIHAASSIGGYTTEWPWYRQLIGAAFTGHTAAVVYGPTPIPTSSGARYGGTIADAPPDAESISEAVAMVTWQNATVLVEDSTCLATHGLATASTRSDEWYGFDANPRENVNVVATVDESTYDPGPGMMGADHPIIWWHNFAGGRSVYNAMGHCAATWHDPAFLDSVMGGITLAATRR